MTINPILVVSLAVAVLVDILAPLALAIFLARRYRGRWRYWLYGLLVFLLSQGITRVPAKTALKFGGNYEVGYELRRSAGAWAAYERGEAG